MLSLTDYIPCEKYRICNYNFYYKLFPVVLAGIHDFLFGVVTISVANTMNFRLLCLMDLTFVQEKIDLMGQTISRLIMLTCSLALVLIEFYCDDIASGTSYNIVTGLEIKTGKAFPFYNQLRHQKEL